MNLRGDNINSKIVPKDGVPELVIEYHGKPPYEAIEFFGGEEALERTKARDEEKAHLCNFYDIGIVYFNYKEVLTEELVKDRIKEYLLKKEVSV